MFSIPEELMLDTKNWEKMNRDLSALLPSELSGAVNLMAHPMAGAMAFSALGVGFASHAFGVWMGTVSGAAEVTQRMLTPIFDELEDDVSSFADEPQSPATRAQAAAKVLIADSQRGGRGGHRHSGRDAGACRGGCRSDAGGFQAAKGDGQARNAG